MLNLVIHFKSLIASYNSFSKINLFKNNKTLLNFWNNIIIFYNNILISTISTSEKLLPLNKLYVFYIINIFLLGFIEILLIVY